MSTINHFSEESFKADVQFEKGIKDAGGHLGTSGQVLSSTGTSTDWITLSANTDNYVDSVSFTESTSTLTIGRTGALSNLTTVISSIDGGLTSDLNTFQTTSSGLLVYERFSNNPTGDIPGSINNANGVLTMYSHSGPYGKQIAFGDNDEMYIRKFSNNTPGAWVTLVHSSNIDSTINTEAGSNNISNIIGLDSTNNLTKRTPAQFISTNQLVTKNTTQTITGNKVFDGTVELTSNTVLMNGLDTADTQERTVLMLNGGDTVKTAELGSLAFSSATYDNYQSFNLKTNGVQRTTIQSGGTLDINAGTNITTSYGAGGVVTINSDVLSGTLTNRHFLLYDSTTGKARTSILKVNTSEAQVDVAGGLQADSIWSEGNLSVYEGNPLKFDLGSDDFEYILTNNNYNAFTSASGAPQGMIYASSNTHHFINGEEQTYYNSVWGGNYENVKAGSFIKDGGTSSQFLKADGSVDTTSYVTTDTSQYISGEKIFESLTVTNGYGLILDGYEDNFIFLYSNANEPGPLEQGQGSASYYPEGLIIGSINGVHFVDGEELNVPNYDEFESELLLSWDHSEVKSKYNKLYCEGVVVPDYYNNSNAFLKADGSVDTTTYLSSVPSTYVTTNTVQTITADKRFTSDTTYFGTDASNSAEVIIDTSNGGNPQISFTDSNDATWAIGVDDTDNNFKIHGASTATIPTIGGLATPLFEVTTLGTVLINGNIVFHQGNDGTGSGLSADTLRGVGLDSFLRSDTGDSKSGYLKVFGATFSSGTDTATDTAIVQEKGNYLYGDDGTYLRKIIGWASDGKLEIGQTSTSLITQINLQPGNSGNSGVKVNGYTVWNAGNDSTLVKTNTTQTISGSKTFTGTSKFHGETEILAGNNDPKLRLKRLTGNSDGDDIADITMQDNGLDFLIDNDNDGDSADFRFRRKTAGSYQTLGLLNNSGFYKYYNGSIVFQVLNSGDVTVSGSGSISVGYDVSSVSNTIGCAGWFRSSGATGWYNGTYGGGIYMADTTYVQVYNSKKFLVNNDAHATNFVLTSDRNLKDKIEPLEVEEIKAEWRTFELKSKPGEKRYGVIAQELLETHPEFVRKDEDAEHYSVAYTDLLIAKVAELEAKNKSLESRLDKLESIIENL